MLLGTSASFAQSPQNTRDQVEAIIESVRANEALYSNIDVSWQSKYTLEIPKKLSGLTRSADGSGHLVQLGDLFRVDTKRKYEVVDGSPGKRSWTQAFDGKTTRVLQDETVGNIVDGRNGTRHALHPHDFVHRTSCIAVPLSTFLEGAVACRAHPMGQLYRTNWKDMYTTTEFVGTEPLADRPCVRLKVTRRYKANGTENIQGISELWLATDRNYIPIKRVTYVPVYAGDVPGETNEITGFRQIGPDVWYPTEMITDIADDFTALRHKKRITAAREVCKIVNVALNPSIDKKVFSDVEFPSSAVVYHVKNDQIVDTTYPSVGFLPTRVPQHSAKPPRSTGLMGFGYVSAILIAIVIVISVGLLWYRLRSR